MPKRVKNRYYDLNTQFRDADGNSYRQADALVLWARMVSGAPRDDGPLKLSPTYNNTPAIKDARLGNKLYSAATFNDAAEINAQVIDTSGRLCFTSLGDAGTPAAGTDRPFSISFWANLDHIGAGTNQYLFGKQGVGGSTEREYGGHFSSTGRAYSMIEDEANSNQLIYAYTAESVIPAGSWHHLVFTYDGSGGATAGLGLKIYVDGDLQSLTVVNNSNYVGMEPKFGNPLHIGGQQDGTDELDGQMAEFAVWNVELGAGAVAAIYNVTRDSLTISGFLNNPARILLHDQDNHTGSYPTVARTGDPDFTGRFNVFFDDTKTVTFFSSYATAEIKFTGVPQEAQSIMLTGSTFENSRRFKFARNSEVPFIYTDLGSSLTGSPSGAPDVVKVDLFNPNARTPTTVFVVASKFAAAVNATEMGIKATRSGRTVKLRQHTPMTGTYLQGSLIHSHSYLTTTDDIPVPIIISQFQQSGPANYAYPMMLPVPTDRDYVAKSTHVLDRIAAPNTTGTIAAPAIMRAGVSDMGIKFTPGELVQVSASMGEDRVSGSVFIPGERLTAFDETRIMMDNDDEFFTVGTSPSVMLGFDQRLSSKTSFSVDLTTSARTDILFTTGTTWGSPAAPAANTLPVNSGLAYYNFTHKRWEIIGNLSTGSNVDYLNGNTEQITGSYLAVIPPYPMIADWTAGDYTFDQATQRRVNYAESTAPWIGLPTDAAGFPLQTKFDATGSQLLDMSQYITAPFLLEKIVLEVSAAFGIPVTTRYTTLYDEVTLGRYDTLNPTPNPMTFILLNQFGTTLAPFTGSGLSETRLTTIRPQPNFPRAVTSSHLAFGTTTKKDIIWFGRFGTFFQTTDSALSHNSMNISPGGWINEATFKKTLPTFHIAADTWQAVPNVYRHLPSASLGSAFYTGTVVIKAPPRVVSKAPELKPIAFHRRQSNIFKEPSAAFGKRNCPRNSNAPLFGIEKGGRDLFGLSSGRSYLNSVVGSRKVGQTTTFAESGARPAESVLGKEYFVDLFDTSNPVRDAPYILMPTDKLILAAVNQIYPFPPLDGLESATYFGTDRPYLYWWEGGDAYNQAVEMAQPRPASVGGGSYKVATGSAPTALSLTFMPDSPAKITFYGTMLRDGRPADFTLNQPLTSDAIHEDVRDDTSPYGEARCLDQFDVDPESSFRGSYLDNILVGKMKDGAPNTSTLPSSHPSKIGDSTKTSRRVVGSVVDGEAGITGSLERFVRMPAPDEVIYDSTVPNLAEIVAKDAGDALDLGLEFKRDNVLGSNPSPLANLLSIYANPAKVTVTGDSARWALSTAFEYTGDERVKGGVEVGLSRSPTIEGVLRDPTGGINSINLVRFYTDGHPYGSGKSVVVGVYTGGIIGPGELTTTAVATLTNTVGLGGPELVLKAMFGIGDHYGQPIDTTKLLPGGHGRNVATYASGSCIGLRGFKYGLINAVPTSPSAVFRYDTFGQFRDMLEPKPCIREYSKMRWSETDEFLGSDFDLELVDESATVEAMFVDRDTHEEVNPELTNCQNISKFVTSSVPYFDNWSPTKDRKLVITTHSERATVERDLLDTSDTFTSFDDEPF